MSITVNEAFVMVFGNVSIGEIILAEDFNLSASISLATGEKGRLCIFLHGDRWHYATAVSGVMENGKFNEGVTDAMHFMYKYKATEAGVLHKTAIPMPEVCCEMCPSKDPHSNGLCGKCNDLISTELGMNQ